MTTPFICIVDDSDDLRFLIQRLVERQYPAYSVAGFASSDALLNELEQEDLLPSLILLDRHMPGLDKHQTLMLLKNILSTNIFRC